MIPVKIQNTSHLVPEAWNELSESLFIESLEILSSSEPKNIKRVQLTRLFLPMSNSVWIQIAPEVISDLCKLVDWLFATPIERVVASIEIGGQIYRFPDPDGYDYTGIQYTHADAMTGEMQDAEDDTPINKLCSMVMISDKVYEPTDRERKLSDFAKMPAWAKLYCSLLYLRAKNTISELYAPAFSEPVNKEEQSEGGYGLIGLFFALAEKQIFGNYQMVCNTNIHEILFYVCYRKEQDDKAAEQQIKNRARNNGTNY